MNRHFSPFSLTRIFLFQGSWYISFCKRLMNQQPLKVNLSFTHRHPKGDLPLRTPILFYPVPPTSKAPRWTFRKQVLSILVLFYRTRESTLGRWRGHVGPLSITASRTLSDNLTIWPARLSWQSDHFTIWQFENLLGCHRNPLVSSKLCEKRCLNIKIKVYMYYTGKYALRNSFICRC